MAFVEVASAGDLLVGASAVNVEADDSMVIGGSILPKYAEGQEGELRAVAVVVEKPGGATVAIVACDVLFVTRDIIDPALARIEEETGIPPEHVLVNATHTHHAPSTARVHGYDRDETFTRRMEEAIVRSVIEAHAQRDGPAALRFRMGEENTVGGNSRRIQEDGRISWIGPKTGPATGPFDPQLPVLLFAAPGSGAEAVIFNHSTHTMGTRNGRVRSPSFYGLAAQELEDRIGATVCFLEGASGSTHNIGNVPTGVAVERMKRAVLFAMEQAEEQPVERLRSIKRTFRFKVRPFDEAVEDEKVASYVEGYAAPERVEPFVEVFRTMRKELAPQRGEERTTPLQAMALGENVAIVGIPAEYFTGLGIDIKERSPFEHTVIAELANDWIGYLPDREAHQLGGYQTWMGLHSYAEIGTGERVADEIVEMLRELKEP